MSDRHIAFTVTLEQPIKDEDSKVIADAIKMIRGVQNVVPVVADAQTHWAKESAARDLTAKILEMTKSW